MNDFRIQDAYLRRIVYILGILGIICLGFYSLSLLKKPFLLLFDLLSPFIMGMLLAYIIAPLVTLIQNKLRIGRIAGTLLVFFLILAVFFAVMAVVVPVVLSQLIAMVDTLRAVVPQLLADMAQSPFLDIDQNLIQTIEEKLRQIEINYEQIVGSILPAVKTATSGGLSTVGQISMSIFQGIRSVIGFGAFLAFVAVIVFYLILDKDRVSPFIRKAIPRAYRDRSIDILEKMDNALGGFLRGQLTVALMVGLMFTVGLFFSGFLGFPALTKFSVLIGTVAGIGGFVPYFGPILGVTPALIIILLSGAPDWGTKLLAGLVVLGLFTVIQAVEGMVLQPKILGKGAALHPLAILLALAAGSWFGITGMIAAVPAACIIRVLLIEFYWQPIQQQSAAEKG